jgi:hypothetical protein
MMFLINNDVRNENVDVPMKKPSKYAHWDILGSQI